MVFEGNQWYPYKLQLKNQENPDKFKTKNFLAQFTQSCLFSD